MTWIRCAFGTDPWCFLIFLTMSSTCCWDCCGKISTCSSTILAIASWLGCLCTGFDSEIGRNHGRHFGCLAQGSYAWPKHSSIGDSILPWFIGFASVFPKATIVITFATTIALFLPVELSSSWQAIRQWLSDKCCRGSFEFGGPCFALDSSR